VKEETNKENEDNNKGINDNDRQQQQEKKLLNLTGRPNRLLALRSRTVEVESEGYTRYFG